MALSKPSFVPVLTLIVESTSIPSTPLVQNHNGTSSAGSSAVQVLTLASALPWETDTAKRGVSLVMSRNTVVHDNFFF